MTGSAAPAAATTLPPGTAASSARPASPWGEAAAGGMGDPAGVTGAVGVPMEGGAMAVGVPMAGGAMAVGVPMAVIVAVAVGAASLPPSSQVTGCALAAARTTLPAVTAASAATHPRLKQKRLPPPCPCLGAWWGLCLGSA